ncbi:hypothetical protein [Celeribacter sp. SCSIO 80788]|uniref:hypothetical protein n=1 Tax=Celeribacter sp. SCSIO 80788 TaxID=3117013 RepID=UPI003DA429A7
MTRIESLKDLLAKVGDGVELFEVQVVARSMASKARDDGQTFDWLLIAQAYQGSLDAAKALHEVFFDGWNVGIMNRVDTGGWQVLIYPVGPKIYDWCCAETPARAWLAAILKALIAQEEAA